MSGINRIIEAKQTWEVASRALTKAATETLPIGTVVEVTLGGRRITGKVVSNQAWWMHHPGYISIENIRTGKVRHSVCPWFGDLEIISLAEVEGGSER